MDHPNITKLVDVFESESLFYLVQELHGNGLDLFEMIDRYQGFNEPTARLIFKQIIDAVAYCHSLNICHRDIKDENIIVDENMVVKLIDFGSSCIIGNDKEFNVFCGTLEYAAPEILLGYPYKGPEVEVWALGVTLYTMLCGEHPFFDPDEILSGFLDPPCDMTNGEISSLRHFFPCLSTSFPFFFALECFDLLVWMLHIEVDQRATITDILSHPWVTGIPGPLHSEES